MNKRILLTGARAPITLDLARFFSKQGDTVILADSTKTPLSRASKYIEKYIFLPKPRECPITYINTLNKVCQDNQIDILVPTCEEIFYIARFKEHINDRTTVFCDNFDKIVKLHNKWEFIQICSNFEISTPQTILLESQNNIATLNLDISDYVFKPVFSRFSARTVLSPTIDLIHEINIGPNEKWVAQKRIIGKEYSSYSIAQNGYLTAHSCYYSHYRAGKGAGIYFEHVEHQAILKFVEQFIRKVNFHGQISFDFIEDETGCYVIECNPRATSGLHLLVENESFRNCFFKPCPTVLPSPQTSKRMISLAMIFYALPKAIRSMNFERFLKDFSRASDVTFDWGDLGPYIYQIISLLSIVLSSITQRKSILSIATSDIEYNGEPI